MKRPDEHVYISRKEYVYICVILGLVILSYFNALSNTFVYDDVVLVYENPFIRSWRYIPRLFTMDYWGHAGIRNTGLYRPLTMLTFLLEYSAVGLKPVLYHLDNILLGFLCSVLVYFNLKLVLKEERAPLYTALLFAIHPVHVESVAWLSGRAELLWSFFALLSTLFFLQEQGRPRHKILSAVLFLIALLAKEGAFILPAILAAYLIVFEKPGPGRSWVSHLFHRLYPFALVFIVYLPFRMLVLKGFGPAGHAQIFENISTYETFLTMSEAFTHYIRLSFLPFNMSIDYMFPPPSSLFEPVVLIPYIVLILTALFARRIIRYSRAVFFAILLFFIALLPVSNIIPVGIIMSERAMYIPVLGPCIILGVILSRAEGCCSYKNGRRLAVLITALILAVFAVNTAKRNPFWRNNEDFLEYRTKMLLHAIELNPGYSYYYFRLAELYVERGNHEAEAEKAALMAVRIAPDNPYAHYELALIYSKGPRLEQALAEVMTTVKINPIDTRARVLEARLLHSLNRSDEALDQLDTAQRFDPGNTDVYKLQGMILGSKARYAEALEKLRTADGISPDNADTHYLMGVAYIGLRQFDAARAELEYVLKLDPGYKDAEDLLQKLP